MEMEQTAGVRKKLIKGLDGDGAVTCLLTQLSAVI